MSWGYLDIDELLRYRERARGQQEGITGGGATTSANAGAYPKPFAGVLTRVFPTEQDQGDDQDIVALLRRHGRKSK